MLRAGWEPAPLRALPRDHPDRWWDVVLHAHSVLNFVWIYEREDEIAAAERADAAARRSGREARMRNYDPRGIERLLARAARRGADALVLTEHNTLSHALDADLPERAGQTRLFRRATEWTAWSRGGHALLLGARDLLRPVSSKNATPEDYRRMLAAARAQGAVSVVCHPLTPGSPWRRPLPEGASAVEVVNSWPFDKTGAEALWHDALRRGERLAAVAGADWHATPGPPIPSDWRVTQVRAATLTEDAIYAAIGAGRTVAVSGKHPGLSLRIEVEGRCTEGDKCRVRTGEPFTVAVEVRGAKGLDLEIFDERSSGPRDPAVRREVNASAFRVAFRRSLTTERGFVRAALRGSSTAALGSPVYLEIR